MKQDVLHQVYISADIESHQLALSREYQEAIHYMLHDDYGHQGLDHTLALVRDSIEVQCTRM